MEEHIPNISADGHLMHRAIQNLMENALKFTPENGHIELNARADENRVHVSITNTGPGIPEAELSHIFNRNVTLGVSSNERSGTGLGLAIVKKIVDMHQASISVRSSAASRMTTFEIVLPLRQRLSRV
jgi:signal transduction histidine kinase